MAAEQGEVQVFLRLEVTVQGGLADPGTGEAAQRFRPTV
jgi:hypothetical protein